ncbi:MAG: peptide ligase PGM1-related protein [Rhodothermales bacterium]
MLRPHISLECLNVGVQKLITEWPRPGSPSERQRFAQLQEAFPKQFQEVFPDPHRARTVVVIPSLSLPPEELKKISGVNHYEERMLFTLMLLRMPRTRLIFITSEPIAPGIIDYYLQLLPGVPSVHAQERLTFWACHDASPIPLAQKVLDRPRLIQRIRHGIVDPSAAHLTCFNATERERTLAVRLGIPLYACDPDLHHLGTKSGSREVFREAGIPFPDGFENLRDLADVTDALTELKRRHPALRRAVVKLDEGFSGEGNAVFTYGDDAPEGAALHAWVQDRLPERLRFEAASETIERYGSAFEEMGGVVELFVEGAVKASPSAQCRVDPLHKPVVISTHDQVLGGPTGQVFLGCTFPAAEPYRMEVQHYGCRVAEILARRGALGRFSVDFVSVESQEGWDHYAIEINLRKGGTTHPYLMLEFLTDGHYDADTGCFLTLDDQPRYYYASDNLVSERYRGLIPRDLVEIAVYHGLHFHGAMQQGVVFHLIGALSEFGKLGVLCIGDSPETARRYYDDTVRVLDLETSGNAPP